MIEAIIRIGEPTFEIPKSKFMLGKNENLNYDIKYDIKVNYNRIM